MTINFRRFGFLNQAEWDQFRDDVINDMPGARKSFDEMVDCEFYEKNKWIYRPKQIHWWDWYDGSGKCVLCACWPERHRERYESGVCDRNCRFTPDELDRIEAESATLPVGQGLSKERIEEIRKKWRQHYEYKPHHFWQSREFMTRVLVAVAVGIGLCILSYFRLK